MVAFTVLGHAEPAGSKQAFIRGGHAKVVDANRKAKPWKKLVAEAAREAMEGHELFTGPVDVEFKFYRKLNVGDVLADGITLSAARLREPYPTSRPDLLKLARACEDAMTGIVYADDAQIVDEILRKRFVTAGNFREVAVFARERVVISVRAI